MDLLIPSFFAAAALVVASGASKVMRPRPAGRALGAVRLPSSHLAVRALGVAEIAIGAWCLIGPSRSSAVSLGLLYLAFAGFLALLLSRDRGTTCGCLGTQDVPPSLLHVVLDVVAAATSFVVANAPPRGALAEAVRLPFHGVPFLAGTILVAYLAYLVAAYLPGSFSSAGGRPSDAVSRFAVDPRSGR